LPSGRSDLPGAELRLPVVGSSAPVIPDTSSFARDGKRRRIKLPDSKETAFSLVLLKNRTLSYFSENHYGNVFYLPFSSQNRTTTQKYFGIIFKIDTIESVFQISSTINKEHGNSS